MRNGVCAWVCGECGDLQNLGVAGKQAAWQHDGHPRAHNLPSIQNQKVFEQMEQLQSEMYSVPRNCADQVPFRLDLLQGEAYLSLVLHEEWRHGGGGSLNGILL